jgi:hypothetical protein
MLDRFKDAMLDRFKNAQWYIGEDGVSVTIYDASDLEGDGPDGHGMVCQDAVIEDARLIAAAVDLLAVAQRVVAMEPGSAMSTLYAAQAAIAKAEGRE